MAPHVRNEIIRQLGGTPPPDELAGVRMTEVGGRTDAPPPVSEMQALISELVDAADVIGRLTNQLRIKVIDLGGMKDEGGSPGKAGGDDPMPLQRTTALNFVIRNLRGHGQHFHESLQRLHELV
jgi:hypothetical protein